jgi:hypothetical protein
MELPAADKLLQLELIASDIMIFWEKDGLIPEAFFKQLGKALGWADYQTFKGVCSGCLSETHKGECSPEP